MPCSLEHENKLLASGISPVAGIDEAGRGPLAGSVFSACVILPMGFQISGLNDSKKLTALQRERLYEKLTSDSTIVWASASIDASEIDRLNILRATHQAMRNAWSRLNPRPVHVLIDGLKVPDFPCDQTPIVGGDGISMSIAAASIIAKVERDREMEEMDRLYPEYGFAKHKGYPTAEHFAKLRQYGPCPIHRRSFAPVAQAELW